jgi:hypothetical protein
MMKEIALSSAFSPPSLRVGLSDAIARSLLTTFETGDERLELGVLQDRGPSDPTLHLLQSDWLSICVPIAC